VVAWLAPIAGTPRGAVDAERVALFAELLQENPSALPPIRAAHVDGVAGYVISDGVHRLHAYRKIGTKDVPVEIWPAGSTGAVYLDALRTATESAAPLTRAEKQQAVARLHAEGHGQREIGRLLGIPTSTVHDWLSGSGRTESTPRRSGPPSSRAERLRDSSPGRSTLWS
jgi:ParB-like chromosome segregation protein Spo0J